VPKSTIHHSLLNMVVPALDYVGAIWHQGALGLSNEQDSVALPVAYFAWTQQSAESAQRRDCIDLPVYFDKSRTHLLFSIPLRRPAALPAEVFSKRGVCLTVFTFE